MRVFVVVVVFFCILCMLVCIWESPYILMLIIIGGFTVFKKIVYVITKSNGFCRKEYYSPRVSMLNFVADIIFILYKVNYSI